MSITPSEEVPLHDPAPATPPTRPATLLRVAWQRQVQERSNRWSRGRLERHQAHALAHLRRFVAERSPFYQRFHAGVADGALAGLPVLDKATLMEQFDDLVTDRSIRLSEVERHLAAAGGPGLYLGRYVPLSTSGSTGRRGVFLFSSHEWIAALAAITRPLRWSGGPTPTWRRPRAALIASAAPWHYSARIGQSLATPLLPTLRLDAALPVAELVRQLNAWQPHMVAAYPSVLRQLAQEQMAGRLSIAPLHLATSAEALTPETRRRAHEAWGLRIFETYGATEYAPIACECAQGNLHLLEDRAIIEVVDARGVAVPPGETGERVLLTVLDRFVQPLIRYEISDCVRERAGSCVCGRPFRMLDGIQGRIEESLRLPAASGSAQGVTLHPNLWHAMLECVPATGWQVLQAGDRISVRLTGEPREGVTQALHTSVLHMLQTQGAAAVTVDIGWVDALERGPSGKAALVAVRAAR